MIPPRPSAPAGRQGFAALISAFRRDLLSALPPHLFRAWMAEYRAPFLRSYLCNDPALVRLVLSERPEDFPKSSRLREGLAPLLGRSVFVTNGPEWAFQRRIVDPAFAGGRLREAFPAIRDGGAAMVARLSPGTRDIEPECSFAAADAIFRAMFSLPIEAEVAAEVFAAFRAHQDTQPIVNLAAILPLPDWLPRLHTRRTRDTAARIRRLITGLVARRQAAIAAGTAPDDLATRLMVTPDPVTGRRFTPAEMVDQVAIFFLAGHETSAAALSWALWLLAMAPDWQDRVAAEARALPDPLTVAPALPVARAVFRETLRLYPPVPMMVRETARPETFRGRTVPKGAQVVISPWHLHRHERLWAAPDAFDPGRWLDRRDAETARAAFLPFSAGPRVCPGAGFAMIEGPLMLAQVVAAFRLAPSAETPVPVARLTIRGRNGIRLRLSRRDERGGDPPPCAS